LLWVLFVVLRAKKSQLVTKPATPVVMLGVNTMLRCLSASVLASVARGSPKYVESVTYMLLSNSCPIFTR
jgi:hypothetical protein